MTVTIKFEGVDEETVYPIETPTDGRDAIETVKAWLEGRADHVAEIRFSRSS